MSLIVKTAHRLVDGARCPENLFAMNDERWTGLDPFHHDSLSLVCLHV